MKKISFKSKYIRRVRAVALSLPILFVFGAVSAFSLAFGALLTVIAVTILSVYVYFYVPLLYNSFGYELGEDEIVIKRGVLFEQSIKARFSKIQYYELSSTPLQSIFKLKSIRIYLCGSVIIMPHMNYIDAKAIAEAIQHHKEKIRDTTT
ncbi:MAG: PH domain-containing protein [Clostridia bacterium]|nr:PH domain-containing protein [Clostridia bacterium]